MSTPSAIPAGSQADAAFLPAPELPRGGLAVHGLGEHWSVNTQTGGLNVSVPLATSPGRDASRAELSLNYAGGGRSAYGYGWGLSVPAVTRRMTKQLPTYTDDDIFGLPGLDDLVPMLEPDGKGGWQPAEHDEVVDGSTYHVRRFRPRTDDTRTRIERCDPAAGGVPFWRSTDAGNVTSTFGRTTASRIADPTDPTARRVSEWLLDEMRDDLGNVASYEYKPEDTVGVQAQPGEQHRLGPGAPPQANRYLKRISYANATPGDPATSRLQVVFDYGEHDLAPAEARPWPARDDAYSVYRTGFEVRTYRLCQRVMIFHDFGADQGPGPLPRLVRTIELGHDATLSRLTSLRHVGYLWSGTSYDSVALPPLEFGWIDPAPASTISDIALPPHVDGAHVHFVDLRSEGLPGVLETTPGGWWYQPPAGSGSFDPPEPVAELPPTGSAGTAGMRDVDGTGRVGVAAEAGGLAGSSVRQLDGSWDRYQPQVTRAVADLADPRLQRLDITGDGMPDLLTRGADALRWTQSLGRDGYGLTRLIPSAATEAAGPSPAADDVAHEWFSADMSGDGLADLVRVRGGRVDYWPNLGWGRYGRRVTMTGTLTLDRPGSFDGVRVRFADLDGTGTTDLVYLGDHTVTAWRNQNGTAWSAPQVIANVPRVDGLAEFQVLDLLGAGSACLIWTSSLPGTVPAARYLDLASQGPPHRLRSMTTNMGARTTIEYDTSARQQLAARRAGQPWRSTTSTAAVVVSAVRAEDEVSQTTHVTRYTYRDAWSDPVERESRGFGCAETFDAEFFSPNPSDLPPIRTIEWFATGRPGDRQDGSYAADPGASLLAGPDRAGITTGLEYEQSARALAGRQVRTETWVDDGGPDAPVVVTQTRCRVRLLQPADGARPAAFRIEALESITTHYERSIDDPRVTHDLTLGTDDHGTPMSTAAVGYPRRVPQIDEQNRTLMTWTLTDATSADDPSAYRVSEVTRVREYDITGVPVPPAGRFDTDALAALLPTVADRDFSAPVTPGLAQRRLRSATRYEFWNDALSGPLPPGQTGIRALTRRVLRFALTPDLVTSVYGIEVPPAVLTAEGGYDLADGLWWVTDGIRGYDATACYLPTSHTTPFGNTATVTWDAHHLLATAVAASTTAPWSLNTTTIANDYATLAPGQITDANGVRRRAESDALGRVVRSWRRAPGGSGDTDPLPGAIYSYDTDAWHSGTGPCWSHSAVRENHADPASPWREQRLFTDGLGRAAMTKTSCEPGDAWADDGHGGVVTVDTTPNPRWIGTGRTVFDNKGNPVEQYEPYFAVNADFDSADALVKHAELQRRRYDALSRLIRVDHPDGTLESVTIGPWQQVNADRNDTVLTSDWYAQRQGGGESGAEQRAATLAAAHANTPQVQLCDPLGRFVRVGIDNGPDGVYETRHTLDGAGEIIEVRDARGVLAGTQVRDAAGRVLQTESIDAGTQFALPDAAGRPLRHFTATGQVVTCRYDLLGRRTELIVADPVTQTQRVAEYTVYGEEHPQAAARLLIGQMHRQYHGAGLSRADRFDLGGNLIEGIRQLLAGPAPSDWATLVGLPLGSLDAAAAPLLDAETFASTGTFDALGRSLSQQYPDGTAITLGYAGGELATVTGLLPGVQAATTFVTGVDYDARRRRTAIRHGNGVAVSIEHDTYSGRATAISAKSGNHTIQDLTYTYDPVGNVVQVQDGAAQTTFFAGAVVPPGALFTFDPAYRLRTASGREHSSLGLQPNQTEPAMPTLPHPNDVNALRGYTETYSYDSVDNITALAHVSSTSTWTRQYDYTPGTNRLASHQLPGDPANGPYSATFDYDGGGNITKTLAITSLTWDHAGQLADLDLGGGGGVTCHYDGSGTRARKIWQRAGSLREERVYLGNLELFRRYLSGRLVFERRTIRVQDGKRTVALVETVTVDADQPGFDSAPRTRYQLWDLLGSVAIECDETGTVISYEEYHPFGTTALWLARGAAAVSTKRYRYVGKEKDEVTGFYAVGARYYVCWLGRWLSPDPAGLLDGVNRYAYVGNNPVSRIDLTGLGGTSVSDWLPQQMFFTESKGLRFPVKATPSGKFAQGHYDYAAEVADLWGAPEGYVLGHPEDLPLWKQKAGTISDVGIQSWESNARQSVQERVDAGAARARGEFNRAGRQTTEWAPGAQKGAWQPQRPPVGGVKPKPPTTGGKVTPTASPGTAAQAVQPPAAKPPAGPPGEQLEVPGVQAEHQLGLFDKPPVPDGPPVTVTPQGGPRQLELFEPPPGNAATAATDAAKTADVAKPVSNVPKAATSTDVTAVAKAADNAKPTLGSTAAVTKDATGVSEVTKDATAAADVAKDVAQASQATQEASAVAQVAKDATLATKVAPLAQDAQAVEKIAKTVTPVAKAVTPALREAGAATKVVRNVVAVAKPVVKVVAPVVKVLGEVAKPLAVAGAVFDLTNAHNNTDRLVASGDLAAGVAMYCGPVGEAFSAGYTVGGLADKGIEKGSKALFGVDLSPSNGISYALDGEDKLISAVIPDDPKKPAYKNENKLAWFLIDTLGF
jgi:RHS repeat-associated protein